MRASKPQTPQRQSPAWAPTRPLLTRPLLTRPLLALALGLALCAPASLATTGPAQADAPRPSDTLRASVLGGWRQADGRQMAALRLDLAPGWKTYWRAPGEAGIAPVFDWSQSDNLAMVRPIWPMPEVFDLGGLRAIGYRDSLVLPLEITPRDPARPVTLRARADLGVCQDVCLPVSIRFAAPLPRPGAPDATIRAALDRRAISAASLGLAPAHCSLAPLASDDGLRLRLSLRLPPPGPGDDAVAVIETADPSLWVSEPTLRREGDQLIAEADILPEGPGPVMLDRSGLVLTVLAGGRAIESRGCAGG